MISPLLANVLLDFVLDSCAQQWRKKNANGDVIIVRYTDDLVPGSQHRWKAEQFLRDLRVRLETYGLRLHPAKTRPIEFGRFAASNRKERGQGKPETFDFLGFTHVCGQTRQGGFTVKRQAMNKRVRVKLQEAKKQLRKRMHGKIREVGAWLRSVVTG